MSAASSEVQPDALPERSGDVLDLQNLVLNAVVVGTPLHETLDLLCRRVEVLATDVYCSVLLLDGDRLRRGAAPSLPQAFSQAIDGAQIGPAEGSCGTCAYHGVEVEVSDIANDPLWANYKQLVLPLGLRACWSSPIKARSGQILGTFALYYGEARKPSAFHRDAVRASTQLAAIAIERARMDEAEQRRLEELSRSNREIEQLNHTLENRVAARTHDLDERNRQLQHAINTLQSTQNELIEVRKLASLGRLVAGVSHTLNTPLGNARLASSTLQVLCDQLCEAPSKPIRRSELLELVGRIHDTAQVLSRAIGEAAERVDTFKNIANEQRLATRTRFKLRDLLEMVLRMRGAALRASACQYQLSVSAALELESYPTPLEDVLVELINNALTHAFATQSAPRLSIDATLRSGDEVEIRVSDNGCGIPAEALEKIFDPFFTTRLSGVCNGLGLSVAHNIAHGLLGGSIRAHSTPGAGTTIVLRIPRVVS